MKRSSVYWLSPSVEEQHQRRASILDEIGYQVLFFENIDTLIKEICIKRAQIVILGDEWPSDAGVRFIHTFANIPDINAARLLLTNSRNDYSLMDTAINEGFRDIIPFDLDDSEWLQRFEFATSGVESILALHEGLDRIDERISISVPARLVWVGAQQLWLETRACPSVGDNIQLQGTFPQTLGLPAIEVQVQQKQQTNLTYRFSEALIGNWYAHTMERAEPEKILETLEKLSNIDLGLRPKIFLAIQSPALRTTLLKYIDRRRYEIHTALQRSSLVYEPKYFSPDLVFIEDRLMTGEGRRNFHELLRFLPEHATIVSIGNKDEDIGQKNNAGKRIRLLKHVPMNLTDLIERDYLAGLAQRRPATVERKAFFPPHEHQLSFASIKAEARLQSADYLQFDMSSDVRIGPYSLIRAESPRLEQIFGGPAFLKIVECPESAKSQTPPYSFKAHLCNLVAPLRAAKAAKDRESEERPRNPKSARN